MIPKLAKILGALVIIGLVIYAIIAFVAPGVFDAFKCVLAQFMTGEADISACSAKLNFKFK